MKNLMTQLSSLMINIKELEKSNEVNPSQTHIIEMIGSHPDITANEIAIRLKVSKGLISQLIKELVVLNYVTQAPDCNDKRVKQLTLTKEGTRIYNCHAESHKILINTLEENLSKNEQETFMKGLDLLNQALLDYEK